MDDTTFDRLLNIQSYNDAALKDLVKRLSEEEREISKRRRMLHAEIDLVRAELVRRLRDKHAAGENLVTEGDLTALTEILSGRGPRGDTADMAPTAASTAAERAAVQPPDEGEEGADAGRPVRERFYDLSANVRDERLIRYIQAQLGQGRNLDEILSDGYMLGHTTEAKRAELMQNPHVLRALQEQIKKQFAEYDSSSRPASEKPRPE